MAKSTPAPDAQAGTVERHEHDAAGCLDCSCDAAPWSSRTRCTCPAAGLTTEADPEVEALAKSLWDDAYHPAMADDREWEQVTGRMRLAYLGKAAGELLTGHATEADQPRDRLRTAVEALEAEVAHWKAHAKEAGEGFAQVCRDAARLSARNVELLRERDRLYALLADQPPTPDEGGARE